MERFVLRELRVVLKDKAGLHARPAANFVQTAARFESLITIATEAGKEADAKSILGVMGLGARQGDIVTITIEGDDEDEAAAALEAFFAAQAEE